MVTSYDTCYFLKYYEYFWGGIMSYQERINNIEKRREKGRKGIPIFGGYSCLYIVSALYEHNISFPKNWDYQRIGDKSVYDAKYRDFLDDDFYVIIRALDNSDIEEMITKIPRNIPILIEDGTKIYDNPNVLYNFKYFMDIDFLYKLIQEDKLYFNCNKEYFPVIVISDFNRDSIHKLEFVEKYLEKYSNVTYSLNIEINSLEALQLLGDFLKDYKNIKIKLNLADDLFFEEEINKNSAREIIRNYDDYSHLLINYILRKDIYYNYLDMNFKSLANVVAFEKMLDVLLARIPREAADLDKITFVVMFITKYFGYDEYNNLYEVMQDKMGVCRDFSALMKTICDRLEINCRILDGGRDIIGHAFNIVTIDGNDYFLDTTCDKILANAS